MSKQLVIVAHNIRSAHNIGALLRTSEGLGVNTLFITGYSPYPALPGDTRLPHEAFKLTKQIHKTALGAESTMHWEQSADILPVLKTLKDLGYTLAGLEQTPNSILLPAYDPPELLAIVLGSEVTGIEQELLQQLDIALEIPMSGQKESFNVVEAASMALYHCTYVGS